MQPAAELTFDTRLSVVKELHLTRCAWASVQRATVVAGSEKAGILVAHKTVTEESAVFALD